MPKAIFITLLFFTLIALAGAPDSNQFPQIVYEYAKDADQKPDFDDSCRRASSGSSEVLPNRRAQSQQPCRCIDFKQKHRALCLT
jgi:hypothetical protein